MFFPVLIPCESLELSRILRSVASFPRLQLEADLEKAERQGEGTPCTENVHRLMVSDKASTQGWDGGGPTSNDSKIFAMKGQ